MEQTSAPKVSGMPVWLVKAFAVVVTVNVCLAILDHWKRFGGSQRFVAVALLAWLVLMPVAATWRWKGARRFAWANLWPTYLGLMLMTSLLGPRL
jgi:hypothetical protein